MFSLVFALLACQHARAPGVAAAPGPAPCAQLDVEMVAGRLFLNLPDGHRLYLDSAGNELIYEEVVVEMGLDRKPWNGTHLVWPDLGSAPPPLSRDGGLMVTDARHGPAATVDRSSGVLGPSWFMARRWVMDLQAGTLALCANPVATTNDAVPLPTSEAGFASIDVVLEGQRHVFLFDTGANTQLTEATHRKLGGERTRAVSFLGGDLFDAWRLAHPTWRYEAEAEEGLGSPMLEARGLTLGDGEVLPPVWFVRREQANFSKFMSQWTDRPVIGALGGNAFAGRVLLLDYPENTLSFLDGPHHPE